MRNIDADSKKLNLALAKGWRAFMFRNWARILAATLLLLMVVLWIAVPQMGQTQGTNTAPTAVDDTATTDEDTTVDIDVVTNDTDAEGDTLSVTSVTTPGNGTAVIVSGSTTTVTYTPNANVNGSDSFDYTLSDGTDTDTGTVTVTVTAVDDAPTAVDDNASTDEDTVVDINVVSNDTDPEEDTLSVTSVTTPSNGTAVITSGSTTTVTYTPNANVNGSDTFDYTLSDGTETDTGTVTVAVAAVNDAPTAVDDTATTDEDTAVDIAVVTNDTDAEGDTLSVTSVTTPGNGTAVITSGSTTTVTYTPNANFNGSDTFDYTVSDGTDTDTGTVTVTVTAVDDAPTAVDDTAATAKNTAVDIAVTANDTDPDGDTLSVTSVTTPGNGTAEIVSGSTTTVTYSPNTNFNGADSFNYTLSDGTGADTGTVTVTVGAPARPAGLTGTGRHRQAILAWDDPSNSSITGYEYHQWVQTAKLTASDGAEKDLFGISIAVDGDTMVAGASGDDDNGVNSGSAYVFTRQSGVWSQVAKLTASDGATDNFFGGRVAVDGDTVVVGVIWDDHNGSHSGSAYVYTKPATGWATATETAKLTAFDGAAFDHFGGSVAVDGDTVVVGTTGDDDNGENSGSAYVFTKPGAGWTSTSTAAKLTASDGDTNDRFGSSIAVEGDTVVVGAMGDYAGSAYVFTKPGAGWTSTSTAVKLTASDGEASDHFGSSIAVDGDTVVVGATGDDDNGSDSGAAYLFVKPGAGWATDTETAKLTADDGATNDAFGYSVAVEGDTVVVSAYGDDDGGPGSGSAYVFVKPSGSNWVTTTETAKLTASDGDTNDRFGSSVAVDGDTVVVGAKYDDDKGSNSGSAYLFTKPPTGWTSTSTAAKLTASDGDADDEFGYSVAVDGDTVVVGAWVDDDNGPYSGSVYVFNTPAGGGWVTAKLLASDGATGDWFGGSVSLDGDRLAVGASGDDDNGSRSGSVYVYEGQSGAWSLIDKLTASDGATDDEFGISVAVDGDTVVVGAHWDDDNGSKSGSAYVYEILDWAAIPDSGAGETNATSYTVTGLANGVEHRFRIRAVNSVGTGPASATTTVTPTT